MKGLIILFKGLSYSLFLGSLFWVLMSIMDIKEFNWYSVVLLIISISFVTFGLLAGMMQNETEKENKRNTTKMKMYLKKKNETI